MPETCLIVCDDPSARQQLRTRTEAMGLEVLEAAGIKPAEKFLTQGPSAMVVVANAEVGKAHDFRQLIKQLPPRTAPGRPKILVLETSQYGGNFADAQIVARLEDVLADGYEDTLRHAMQMR